MSRTKGPESPEHKSIEKTVGKYGFVENEHNNSSPFVYFMIKVFLFESMCLGGPQNIRELTFCPPEDQLV